MRVTITMGGDDAGDDARHLYRWLCDADQLRHKARVQLTSSGPSDKSTMGPGLDVLDIVLASGFSAANLAATLAMWRAARPRTGTATLTVGTTTVTVQDGSPETVRAIVDALTANATPAQVPGTAAPAATADPHAPEAAEGTS